MGVRCCCLKVRFYVKTGLGHELNGEVEGVEEALRPFMNTLSYIPRLAELHFRDFEDSK